MVGLRDPASVGIATRVLAIPLKRANTKVREYVTREEMEAILVSIDRACWCGRRDYAMLLTMYNLGAGVWRSPVFARAMSPLGPTATFSCMGRVEKIARYPCGPGPRGF